MSRRPHRITPTYSDAHYPVLVRVVSDPAVEQIDALDGMTATVVDLLPTKIAWWRRVLRWLHLS